MNQPMVHDHFVTLHKLQFHYREWSRRGVPLILLHGLSSQSHIFDRVAPRLADHFRVIALDQRGHGESDKPDEGYDFKTVAGDLLVLLDALKLKRAIIAGHSWGGAVALYFAAHHSGRARAVILIDGGFGDMQADPEMTWERTERELAPAYMEGMPVQEFQARIKQYAGKLWSPSLEATILANFEVTPDRTIHRRLSHANHMKILRALWEQRPAALYPLVKCPALLLPAVMETEKDPARAARRRAQIQIAVASLNSAEITWFHDTIHDIPLHRPRKLANVITRFARDQNIIHSEISKRE